MLSFFAGGFALAGLIAAAAPIVIHLLNRRRHRVVDWAAMDFLKEALRRSRRVLHLRDVLLLALRVLCVLLFGLALARPYFAQVGDQTLGIAIGIAVAVLIAFGAAIWAAVAGPSRGRAVALATAALMALTAGLGIYHLSQTAGAGPTQALSSREPVHAVFVIDNSLSMSYGGLQGSLIDQAREAVSRCIDELPRGSRMSIIPLCGPQSSFSTEPYRTRQDAFDALKAVRAVDRQGSLQTAAALAMEAIAKAPDLPAKRIVLVGDQQRSYWNTGALEALRPLPELQVVRIAPAEREPSNTWISDLRLRDGLADAEVEATLLATLRHVGAEPRRDLQVTIEVDGAVVATRTVDLQPGQTLELEFQHKFDVAAEPGRPAFSLVKASLPPDALPGDDQRHLTVPVLAAVPVVFVDRYGAAAEDPSKDRYGESYQLRRLLAPTTSRSAPEKQLVQIRHTTLERLLRSAPLDVPADDELADEALGAPGSRLGSLRGVLGGALGGDVNGAGNAALAQPLGPIVGSALGSSDGAPLNDARLVVVAGATRPDPAAVQLLREYVVQGGQLVIAAGSDFDPAAWTEIAWRDGGGILPLPLKAAPVGQTPAESTGRLTPFFLDYASLSQNPYFKIENVATEELADLYSLPLFFKAAAVDDSPETLQALAAADLQRFREDQAFLQRIEALRRSSLDRQQALSPSDQERLAELQPDWLLWSRESWHRSLFAAGAAPPVVRTAAAGDETDVAAIESAALANAASSDPSVDASPALLTMSAADLSAWQPRVLARFSNGLPFLVERRIGEGRVVMVATGVFSSPSGQGWNTLPLTDAMLVFDRLLRSMIESTLLQSNYEGAESVALPVAPALRRSRFTLERPGAAEEPLLIDALGEDRYALVVREPVDRGHYRVTARRPESAQYEGLDTKLWELPLAVNGPAGESAIEPLDEAGFAELIDPSDHDLLRKIRWISPGQPIRVEGALATGQNIWWRVLLIGVIACLLFEMLVLGILGRGRPTAAAAGTPGGATPGGTASAGATLPGAPMSTGTTSTGTTSTGTTSTGTKSKGIKPATAASVSAGGRRS